MVIDEHCDQNTDSGVQARASDVYDPVNGKSCHQCRQKTKGFASSCKRLKNNKQCLTFCSKCLLNRYGENSEKVRRLEDWICPKCRGVRNCICCRKIKGLQPTGIHTPTARESGFSSVLHYLDNKSAEALEFQKVDSATSIRTRDEEHCIEQKHIKLNDEGLPKWEKKGSTTLKIKDNRDSKEAIVFPLGMPSIDVAVIELPVQDIGAVLDFLEFCNAFAEVLDIRIGQPECILQDIFRGAVERHEEHSALVEFNINLLSLVEDIEKEGDAWLKILKRCIDESQCILDELPVDFLDSGSSGCDNLEASGKLKILNFLCDEVLASEKLRKCIDEVTVKFDKDRKENKEKVVAAK